MENENKPPIEKKPPEYLFIPLLARERLLVEIILVIDQLNKKGSNIKEYAYTNINIVSVLMGEKPVLRLCSLLTIYKTISQDSKLHNCINYLIDLEKNGEGVARFRNTYDEDGNILRYPTEDLINTEREKGIIPAGIGSHIKAGCVSPSGEVLRYTSQEQRIASFIKQILQAEKIYLPITPKDNFMYASIQKAKDLNLLYKKQDIKNHPNNLITNLYIYSGYDYTNTYSQKLIRFNVSKKFHDDNFINLIVSLIQNQGYTYQMNYI
ncbi:MAG: hypothetical protein R3Y29_07470 [bacterium]